MASRAQYNYATIEKEMLTICFGCQRFHEYVYRKEIQIQMDYKPLISIMTKPVHKLSARIQCMHMRLQNYNIYLTHVKGTQLFFADTLSRAHSDSLELKDLFNDELSMAKINSTFDILHSIKDEYKTDEKMIETMKQISQGWETPHTILPPSVQIYHKYKDELCIQDNMIVMGNRLLIPQNNRKKVLKILHETHLGITKIKQLTRDTVFWLNIDTQITDLIMQ